MKVSIDDLMNELDDARLTARANGQASAMVAATMSKAKLLGLDKADSEHNNEPQPVSVIVNVKDARKPEHPENTWDTAYCLVPSVGVKLLGCIKRT